MINNDRERYIVTPLDKYSFDELNFGKEPSNYKRFDLNNDEFLCLLKSGILDEINIKLNVFIDDFEQIVIDNDKLDELFLIVNNYVKWNQFLLQKLLRKLLNQIEIAIENKTGIFFMF